MRKIRLFNMWYDIKSSFWFIPLLMIFSSFIFSLFTLFIDQVLYKEELFQSYEYTQNILKYFVFVGADGARSVLTTVSGSMITVAGVTFSITIVSLTMAASQFGSRLLVNFMQDKSTQFVLGTFVSTYVYCLLVLRSVHSDYENLFVPTFSVNCAVLLAFFNVGVLVFFIHHISISIKAECVIDSVYKQLKLDIDRMFIDGDHEKSDDDSIKQTDFNSPELAAEYPAKSAMYSPKTGYLQAIDYDKLMELSVEKDLVVQLETKAGDYFVPGFPVATIRSKSRIQGEFVTGLSDVFLCGHQRTGEQDIESGIHQLVEIAVRSLSPGINDPFTAISCIDCLSSVFTILAQKRPPAAWHHDAEGCLRVLAKPVEYSMLLEAAFNQIRQNSKTSVAVTIRLMDAYHRIAFSLKDVANKAVLRRHVEMLLAAGACNIDCEHDMQDLKRRYDDCIDLLDIT
ncbi:DUF2254 domain-containing protein [Desulfogranum marinum]|uniref:DUF2254 domain-containing protein n=1 Tax=Desulfogranum marinum TaxID=453220 RepID=UPI0029C6BE03|nr:DUF2254 domain-containing protein [Desulfogranum marinum]